MLIETQVKTITTPIEIEARANLTNLAYSIGGYNVADDIISAITFCHSLLEDEVMQRVFEDLDEEFTPKEFAQCIKDNIEAFESGHRDPEGYGIGTLVDIVKELESLDLNS